MGAKNVMNSKKVVKNVMSQKGSPYGPSNELLMHFWPPMINPIFDCYSNRNPIVYQGFNDIGDSFMMVGEYLCW